MASPVPNGDTGVPPAQEVEGLVIAIQANYYRVQVAAGTQPSLLCTRRARLKKTGQRVMVGDRVQLEALDWDNRRAVIAAVSPRQAVLDRPPIANVEHILLVFALAQPDLDPQQLGRFLVQAEATGVPISLCLNKRDLVSEAICRHWQDCLAQWGYRAIALSLHQDDPLKTLQPLIQGRTTVISGPSGVGKSSLINRLIPQASLRTGAVSGKLGRGRHTTRHVELFALLGGGFLADTPGFNQPDLTLLPEKLGACFPEIRQRLAQASCQFQDCLHQGSPGCAVGVDWPRYDLYRTLLAEAIDYKAQAQQQSAPEASLKVKAGEGGQPQHEPRLATKKYRRLSRRSQRQALDDLRHSLDGDGLDWDDASEPGGDRG
jgi:ribosome biogenesis GTPase